MFGLEVLAPPDDGDVRQPRLGGTARRRLKRALPQAFWVLTKCKKQHHTVGCVVLESVAPLGPTSQASPDDQEQARCLSNGDSHLRWQIGASAELDQPFVMPAAAVHGHIGNLPNGGAHAELLTRTGRSHAEGVATRATVRELVAQSSNSQRFWTVHERFAKSAVQGTLQAILTTRGQGTKAGVVLPGLDNCSHRSGNQRMYAACNVHRACYKYKQVRQFPSMREGLAFMAAWAVSASCLEVDAHKAFNPSESDVNKMLPYVHVD
jgi:hypothetical protein